MYVIGVQNLLRSKGSRRLLVFNYNKRRITMNDNNLKYAKCERKSDKFKARQWKEIDWKKAEEFVNRLQIRIVKATKANKKNLVKRLQYLLVNSFYAKVIAIKKVTSNKGKRTSGIDGQIWATSEDKIEAIDELNTKAYRAKPTRRIHVIKNIFKR